MRTKKFLSVIAALALLAQSAISAPLALAAGETTKVGLVYSQEAETATDWTANEYFSAETTATGVKYTAVTNSWPSAIGMTEIPLGDKAIKFEDDKIIVIETQVKVDKGTGTARVGLYYNRGSQIKDEDNTGTGTGATKGPKDVNHALNHLFIAGLYDNQTADKMQVIYPQGVTGAGATAAAKDQTSVFWPGDRNGDYAVGYALDGETSYKMVVKLDVLGNTLDYELYSGGNLVKDYTTTDLGWVTVSETLDTLHFANMSNPAQSIEVDYVKVYNVPAAEKDNYTAATWQTAFDEIAISDVKVDGVAITDGFEATNGTVTFTASSDVTVKEVSYNKGAGKVTLEEDDYTFTNNNTVTFTDALESSATYTVLLDLGYTTYPITFNSAYVAKLGLVFQNDGTSGFAVPSEFSDVNLAYTANSATFSVTNKRHEVDGTKSPYTYVSLGADKVKFESGKTVIVESRVKFTNNINAMLRYKLGYNMPASNPSAFRLKNKSKYVPNTDLGMIEIFTWSGPESGARVMNAGYWAGDTKLATAADIDGKWYKVVMKITEGTTFDYAIYKEDGSLFAEWNSKTPTYVSASEYLENVSFGATHGTDGQTGSMDVDYVKVFNVPTAEKNNYATYGVFSDMKLNGAAVSGTPEIAEGATTVTFNSTQDDVTVKIVKESIKTGAKATLASSEYTFTNNAGVAAKSVTFTTERGYKYSVALGVNGAENVITFATPWNNQTGLLIDEDGTGSETWTTSSGANFTAQADGYLRLTVDATNKYASVSLPEPIQLQDDNEVVIDARFRGDNLVAEEVTETLLADRNGRVQLKYNVDGTNNMVFNKVGYPETELPQYETGYKVGANHLALFSEQAGNGIRFAGPNYPYTEGSTLYQQSSWISDYVTNDLNNKWYRIVIRISKDFYTEYTLYDEDNRLVAREAGYQGWTSKEHGNFIKNIQFMIFNVRSNGTPTTADLDYLKVYNIEKDSDDAVLTSNNNTATLTIETPATAEAIGATLYVASYVGGQLKAVDMATVTGATTTVTVPEIAGATYKTFLWDGNMKPVAHK